MIIRFLGGGTTFQYNRKEGKRWVSDLLSDDLQGRRSEAVIREVISRG